MASLVIVVVGGQFRLHVALVQHIDQQRISLKVLQQRLCLISVKGLAIAGNTTGQVLQEHLILLLLIRCFDSASEQAAALLYCLVFLLNAMIFLWVFGVRLFGTRVDDLFGG